MSKGINWVDEKTACEKLGLTKYTLRTYTRDKERKKLFIRTSKLSKTVILYSGTDIENYILQKATAYDTFQNNHTTQQKRI
jgi:hypothetical protein